MNGSYRHFAIFAGMAWAAFAQTDAATATLKGYISDPSGAVVAGANVSVRSLRLGLTRGGVSNAEGLYQFLYLQPGGYELRVEAGGFKTTVMEGIELTVGEVASRDVALTIGTIAEEITIQSSPAMLEPERTQQANTIRESQITNFPNVGRFFTSYVFTLPGVASSEAPRAQNPGFTFGTSGFSIGGSNGRNNLVTMDGGELEYGSGQLRVTTISVEAVREFQVNRNAFAAEFGFTAGTAVNVVTKGGSNEFHGSTYLFFRSQKTSARNFFDLNRRRAFDQQMYPGFTLGGPISKNRLFFFTSYEAIKSDAARFRAYTNNPAILGPSLAQESYLARLETAADTNIRRISQVLRGALNTRNFPDTMKLLQDNEGTFTAAARTHTWLSKIDYQISSNDWVSGRFSLMRSDSDQTGISNALAPSNATDLFSRDYTAVFTWMRTQRANLLNTARVQVVPNNSARTIAKSPDSPLLIVPGVGSFGRNFAAPFNTFQDRYQFEDNLLWIKGRHNFKFGASYRPVNYRVINELWFGGQWNFASGTYPLALALPAADQSALGQFNVVNGLPAAGPATANFTALQSLNLGLPFLYRQGFGTPRWNDWAHFLGTFAQDSWKVHPRFTLDLGVRFDFDNEPAPLGSYKMTSPRLGLSWDIQGNQKTVIRAGGGLFYSPIYYQVAYVTNLLNDSGKFINQLFRTPAFPATQTPIALWGLGRRLGKLPFTSLSEQDVNSAGISTGRGAPGRVLFDAHPDYENNYSGQISFSLSREITKDLGLEVAYQMYRGVHIQLPHEVNYRESGTSAGPGLGPRLVPIDPTITQLNLYSSIGNSIYHGMTASLTKRYSRNTQLQIHYTFSKAIDNVTDFNSAFAAFLPTRLDLDRAVSVFNISHNFVASGVFTSPFQKGPGRNVMERALADITFSPVVFLRSGIPFTLRTGFDTNGDTHGDYDRPFFAGRNTALGENFYSVDARLIKQFYVKADGSLRVEFVAEGSNLLNRTNFVSVNDVVGVDPQFLFGPYNLRGSRNISRTSPLGFNAAASARQLQFAVKIVF
ncbi:MAG: TonB-dependent receptor [Acidimicrobiia bacterium]|nr:TonB-dependent receptor [Acidimicrobiia bacterium]